MKQKVLISGLSLLLTFSLAGCGGQQTQQEPQEPKQEVQQSGAISTEPPAEPLEVKQEVVPTATAVPSEADPAEEVADQEEDLTEEVQLFTDCNETVYATGTVNLRNGAGTSFEKVGSLNKGDSVTRTGTAIAGTEAEGWSRIQLSDGSTVYVSNKYLSTTKPVVQQQQTSKPSGGSSTTTQGETQQPQQPSDVPGIDKPSGTPITGGQGSQPQQPSAGNNPFIGDRTDPNFLENETKAMGGDLSGGHIVSWDDFYGN